MNPNTAFSAMTLEQEKARTSPGRNDDNSTVVEPDAEDAKLFSPRVWREVGSGQPSGQLCATRRDGRIRREC